MFPLTSTTSCQIALLRHGIKFTPMKCEGKTKWNKYTVKINVVKLIKYPWLINKLYDIPDIKMCEKFECKYMTTLQLYNSLCMTKQSHASSSPNPNIMSIKAHLNSTSSTVCAHKYSFLTCLILWAWWSGAQFLVGERNFSHPRNEQMGCGPTQPPVQWVLGLLYQE
jgi:hypothetical protein